jgi:hypothetical protein
MKMNMKKLIAAVVTLSAAGFSLADNGLPYVDYSKFESARNRADVVTALDSGGAGQSTANNEYHQFTTVGSGLTRAEVIALLEKDFAEGRYLNLANSEFIDYANLVPTKTRSQVHHEAGQSGKSRNLVNRVSGS